MYVGRSGDWDTRMRLYVWDVCGGIGAVSRRIRGYVLEWGAYMGRSTPVGTREGGCMYCEVGGDVCGEIERSGHEKEVVCMCGGNRYAQATAYLRLENINTYAQDTGGVRGGSGRLGHENEDVCIESGEVLINTLQLKKNNWIERRLQNEQTCLCYSGPACPVNMGVCALASSHSARRVSLYRRVWPSHSVLVAPDTPRRSKPPYNQPVDATEWQFGCACSNSAACCRRRAVR